MLPKTRLGKRSPMGALVGSSCIPTDEETGETVITMATGCPGIGRLRHHPGLKVSSQCSGHGSSGLADKLDFMQTHSSVLKRVEDVWPSSLSTSRSVSSCIEVPRSRGSPEEAEMDEMMAAMILTSLSCSPLLHSPTHPDTKAPPTDCVGGELSDSGSSGYWSVGCSSRSPVPSPPIAEADVGLAVPPDEGLDMELEQVLFDEPSPRKRRNSVKVVFRCLWPSCEKVLTSTVGIKRHIRMMHLSQGGDQERCSRSEEDFYYTEIHRPQQSPAPASPSSSSPSPPPPPPPPLSRSAPSGTIWQVQSEHSYQAPPQPHKVSAAAPSPAFCQWTVPPTSFQSRLVNLVHSVSIGEPSQHHSAPFRRIRGEAKKCRKVYGIERREQWCTACRWKKACQRFID
ncbi:zinc finger protein 395-like [Genypterus blacodes]|uniref:zinc finger protein 395-like n=1 Tax=Genypterus blacodes TaxID=154954 RepID=UPI003F769638